MTLWLRHDDVASRVLQLSWEERHGGVERISLNVYILFIVSFLVFLRFNRNNARLLRLTWKAGEFWPITGALLTGFGAGMTVPPSIKTTTNINDNNYSTLSHRHLYVYHWVTCTQELFQLHCQFNDCQTS